MPCLDILKQFVHDNNYELSKSDHMDLSTLRATKINDIENNIGKASRLALKRKIIDVTEAVLTCAVFPVLLRHAVDMGLSDGRYPYHNQTHGGAGT